MLALATKVVSDYGKVLAEVMPGVHGVPESLLPHSKAQIRASIEVPSSRTCTGQARHRAARTGWRHDACIPENGDSVNARSRHAQVLLQRGVEQPRRSCLESGPRFQ
jgi:hypothetical protein